jgi:hypothetical protein
MAWEPGDDICPPWPWWKPWPGPRPPWWDTRLVKVGEEIFAGLTMVNMAGHLAGWGGQRSGACPMRTERNRAA